MAKFSKYALSALCLLALAMFVPQAKADSADFGCSSVGTCNGAVAANGSGGYGTTGINVVANSFNLPGLGDGDEAGEHFLVAFSVNSGGTGTISITDTTDADATLTGNIVSSGTTLLGSNIGILLNVVWTMPSGFQSVGSIRVNGTAGTNGAFAVNFVDVSVLPTPEPASLLLLGTGLLGVGAAFRRRLIG